MSKQDYKKTQDRREKKSLLLTIVVVVSLLILFTLSILFSKDAFSKKNLYVEKMAERYKYNSEYIRRLNYINSTFNHENKYMIGKNYVEKDFYKWTDTNKLSLNSKISIELAEYFKEKNIDRNKISLYIISLRGGDQFKLNEERDFIYADLDKLVVNMLIKSLEENKAVDMEAKVELKKNDFEKGSLFFNKDSIGVSYPIKELMKISFKNDDITARNMLKSFINESQRLGYQDIITREYSIGISDDRNNAEETIKLAREFYENKYIYQDLLTQLTDKKSERYFQNYIIKDSKYNFLNVNGKYYYEFGYVEGISEYLYSINTYDIENETIRDIGEIIDRNINDYYLKKEN